MARGRKYDGTLDLGGWFILRMASSDTLKVAEALKRFDVWTPVEHRMGRMPRTRAPYDKKFSLMPSYSFAPVEHLDSLLALSAIHCHDMPRFSVFTFKGGVPLIADDQLGPLRTEEERTRRVYEKAKRRDAKGVKFSGGDKVRLDEGPFAGMSGVVEKQAGQYTLVSFSGFHKPIQIASLLLLPDMQCAQTDIAAEAA